MPTSADTLVPKIPFFGSYVARPPLLDLGTALGLSYDVKGVQGYELYTI